MPTNFFFKGDPTFGANRIATQIKKAKQKSAVKAQKLLLQPTSTWTHKANFTIEDSGDKTEIGTDDEVYGFLDNGTPPHIIEGNPYLRFQENFKPKTVVNSLNSVHGGKSGAYVNPPPEIVHHPGNEARNFTTVVIKQIEPEFQADIQAEIDKSIA